MLWQAVLGNLDQVVAAALNATFQAIGLDCFFVEIAEPGIVPFSLVEAAFPS